MALGVGTALGLGVVLTMANRLSGPAMAASASMQALTIQTEKARLAQLRFGVATRIGAVALIGGAGVSLALVGVVKSAARFEEGMARVGAILDPTTSQLRTLTSAAIEAGISTQWTPRQATEGLKELATAGFTAEEATKALLPVLDLATGSLGQLGVAEAAMAASAALRGFGFDVKEATSVTDKLLRATQLSNIQARDLTVMLSRVSGNARAAGQEFEHTVTVLGALRNTGAEASVSATTLRSALRAITQEQASRTMAQLGVSLFDVRGNFRDLAPVIFDLEKRLAGVTEQERQAALMSIFGARGLNTYNAVVGMGADKFAHMELELKTANGTAAEFRKKTLEPLTGRLILLGGSLSTLATQFGTPLLGPIKTLVTIFTKFVNLIITLTTWFPRTTKLIMLVIGLGAVLSVLIGTMLLLGSAIIALNMKYGLLAKAKAAYLIISRLILGVEGYTRLQLLGLIIAEQFRITQTTLMNAKMKIRLLLESLLGIGISSRTSVTWAAVSASTADRIATVGNSIALTINNALQRLSTGLRWGNIRATLFQAKTTVMSSTAMRAGAAGAGLLTGALRGLWAVIIANPILALIAAVLLAIVIVSKVARAFWEAKGSAQAFWAFILFAISPILGTLIITAKMFAVAWKQNLGGVREAFFTMKKAIGSIFAPLGRLFSAMGGIGPLGKLFKSIMTVVMLPFAKMFEVMAFFAAVNGAVIEIIVQEMEAAFAPLVPVIDELSSAFDALGVALFGRGGRNISFWKTFGVITRAIVRGTLVPMAKIVGWLVGVFTTLTRWVTNLVDPLQRVAKLVKDIFMKGTPTGWLLGAIGSVVGLQHGGIVTKPTVAALAEEGKPEMVLPLPTGLTPKDIAQVFRAITQGRAPAMAGAGAGAPTTIVIENRIFLDGREIQRQTKELTDLQNLRSFY